MNLGVGETYVRPRFLRRCRRLLLAVGDDLAPAHGHLLGTGPGERDGGFLGFDLFEQGSQPGLVDVVVRARGVERLRRVHAFLHHPLRALEDDLRIFELGLGGSEL